MKRFLGAATKFANQRSECNFDITWSELVCKKLGMFCFVGLIFVKCGYFIASDLVTFSSIQSISNACSLLDAGSDCNSVFV
jgi:hypothetical protein